MLLTTPPFDDIKEGDRRDVVGEALGAPDQVLEQEDLRLGFAKDFVREWTWWDYCNKTFTANTVCRLLAGMRRSGEIPYSWL